MIRCSPPCGRDGSWCDVALDLLTVTSHVITSPSHPCVPQASDLALAAEALGLGGMAGGKVAPGGGLEGLCSDMALFSAEKFRDAGKRLGTRVCEVGISASGSSDKARGFMKELVGSAGEL